MGKITKGEIDLDSGDISTKLTNVELIFQDVGINSQLDPQVFDKFCEILSDLLIVNVDASFTPFLNQSLLDLVVKKLNRRKREFSF